MLDPEFLDSERTWAEETLAAAAGRAAAAGLEAETIIAKGPAVAGRVRHCASAGGRGWS